jgi:tol-pal system protein YbgF
MFKCVCKFSFLVSFSFLLFACAGLGGGSSQSSANSTADEVNNLRSAIQELQSSVNKITLTSDALVAENAQTADAIVELQTELTYLSNELTILRSNRPQTSLPPSTSSTERPSIPTDISTGSSAPKIVIIEDLQSMKDSLYKFAYELYVQGKHQESIEKFKEFLQKLPNDDLADNSQYWIGENYYSMHNYSQAIDEFRRVLSRYPEGGKVPDALLKIGYSYHEMGQNADAINTLNEVVSKYPRSESAALARQMLARWK